MIINDYSETVIEVIRKFIDEWRKAPFNFISEADIRSHLYLKLRDEFLKPMQLIVLKNGIQDEFIDKTTLPIHCEMAIPDDHARHVDIGIWCENSPRHNIDYKNFAICIGIEIKYYWLKKPYATIINGVVEDLDKLLKIKEKCSDKFTGYVLVFLPRINGPNSETEIKTKLEKKTGAKGLKLNNNIEVYLIFMTNDIAPLNFNT